MKKNLKGLKLNKKSISNFEYVQLKGGDRGTEDITNCGALCAQPTPKTNDGCGGGFGTHSGETFFGGLCSYCDV